VAAEVNRLPQPYRAALMLCCWEGKTAAQAARELGCPIGSISGRLRQGRELLRRRLAGLQRDRTVNRLGRSRPEGLSRNRGPA
jgi:DNA-directed RNA polymerase specialized sigma24 family protein